MNKSSTIKNVAVYLGSADVHNQVFRQAVVDLANFLADHNMTLVFGGSSSCGMMKLLADTMLEHNGKVIGIFTKSLPEKFIRHDLTESVITENLAERKAEMLNRADAIVALPGSIGTFDELFDAFAQKKLVVVSCPIGVLNIDDFFEPLFKLLKKSKKPVSLSKKLLPCSNAAPPRRTFPENSLMLKNEYSIIEIVADLTNCYENALPGSPPKKTPR